MKSNKEYLTFIGLVLSLDINFDSINSVRSLLRDEKIDFEKLNWILSTHLMLPAFYVKMKQFKLLFYLPKDFVKHLEDIYTMNKNRNTQILKQIAEISHDLHKHKIAPVYLKGCAMILNNEYEDIGERMIGDIDFLVKEDEMQIAAKVLIDKGYTPLVPFENSQLKLYKHYPRLINENKTAAIEVHQFLLRPPKHHLSLKVSEFIAESQKNERFENTYIPSEKHLILHNILNTQVNDTGFYRGTIHLRQLFELYLLLRKNSIEAILGDFNSHREKIITNCIIMDEIFRSRNISQSNRLRFRFIKALVLYIVDKPRLYNAIHIIVYLMWRLYNNLSVLVKAVFNKELRISVLKRLNDPKWYKEHLKSYLNVS